MGKRSSDRWLADHGAAAVLVLASIVGLASFAYYQSLGWTTAHYDAKAHLVVARRIVDSISPGYLQMGVHWLPLTHLLYLPLVVWETQYRTGVLPSLLSVLAFALSAWLVFKLAFRMTELPWAGLFASALLIANPNLRYLQSCPLTEPLFMVLMLLGVYTFMRWRDGDPATLPWSASIWFALSALCRYEGWLLLAGVLAILYRDYRAGSRSDKNLVRAMALFALMFAVPVGLHFGYLWVRVGDSFLHRVARGYPEPYWTVKNPLYSLVAHFGELAQAATLLPLLLGLAGVVYMLRCGRPLHRWYPLLLLWVPSVMNIGALYWGLIYRVRYSVLLLPAIVIFSSALLQSETTRRRSLVLFCTGVMLLPWLPWYFPPDWNHHFVSKGPGIVVLPAAALALFVLSGIAGIVRMNLLLLCLLSLQLPALDGEDHAIFEETFEHNYIEPERRKIIEHLLANRDGLPILIDMGRLAPLVFDSRLPVKRFVYNEGDKEHWRRALRDPPGEVGWICIEKGDELWHLLQVDPSKYGGYSLAVETEHYRLYRLNPGARERLLKRGSPRQ